MKLIAKSETKPWVRIGNNFGDALWYKTTELPTDTLDIIKNTRNGDDVEFTSVKVKNENILTTFGVQTEPTSSSTTETSKSVPNKTVEAPKYDKVDEGIGNSQTNEDVIVYPIKENLSDVKVDKSADTNCACNKKEDYDKVATANALMAFAGTPMTIEERFDLIEKIYNKFKSL